MDDSKLTKIFAIALPFTAQKGAINPRGPQSQMNAQSLNERIGGVRVRGCFYTLEIIQHHKKKGKYNQTQSLGHSYPFER